MTPERRARLGQIAANVLTMVMLGATAVSVIGEFANAAMMARAALRVAIISGIAVGLSLVWTAKEPKFSDRVTASAVMLVFGYLFWKMS